MPQLPHTIVHALEVSAAASDAATVASLKTDARRPGQGSTLGLFMALWRRDMLRLRGDFSRWLGVALQPLLFWAILSAGMGSMVQTEAIGGLDAFRFFFPGLLVMVVLFTTVFATMAVIEDRQSGFLQQVMVGPGHRVALVLGKTAGVTTIAAVQVAMVTVIAPFAGFDLLDVSWWMFASALLLTSVGLTALSFALAWVVPSTHGYHALMAVFLLPLWLVSGALFPSSGGVIGAIMTINPMTYAVDGFRHAMLGGAAPISLVDAGVCFAVLGGFAVATVALCVWLTGRVRGVVR